MGNFTRKMERNKAKSEGTLIHKKALAKKFGCSVNELNKRLKRREKNLKEIGEVKNDGREKE